MSTVTAPSVSWAQRSILADEASQLHNRLILSIEVPKVANGKFDLNVTDSSISFKAATSTGTAYEFAFDFLHPVVGADAKVSHSGDVVRVLIPKKDQQEEYWPRLTEDKSKRHYLRTDFTMWADEDEQNEADTADLGNMGNISDHNPMAGGMPGFGDMSNFDMGSLGDMAGLGGMGGMGGMGGLGDMAGLGDMSGLGDMGGLDEGEDLSDDESDPTKAEATVQEVTQDKAESAAAPKIEELGEDKASS